jgi:tRNA nucleotidyltransferase (CCA-adding enzyme)
VVEGSAIQLANSLAAKYGGQITVHRRFGTAKWILDRSATPGRPGGGSKGRRHADIRLDLISARSEVYPRPAQLPHVRLGTIEEDLQRRDFTINTLAIRLDGKHFGMVLDPLGALEDMKRGAIRVLHDKSFQDDPTRMYRAVRYEKRLGFKIAPGTLRLTPNARRWVDQLSAHRIRQELEQILEEDQAAAMLSRLGRLGLLSAVHRALPDDDRALRWLRNGKPARSDAADARGGTRERAKLWLLWLMDLTPAQIESVRRRLCFDNKLTSELVAASELRGDIKSLIRLRPSRLTEHLRGLPLGAVEAVQAAFPPGRPRRLLEEYLTTWRHIRPRATGLDLKALGIPPGPAYRSILQELRAAWIDGTIKSVAEERLEIENYVRRLRRAGVRTTVKGPA